MPAATLAAVEALAATRITACVPWVPLLIIAAVAVLLATVGRVSNPLATIVSAIVRAGAVAFAAVPVRRGLSSARL